MQSDSRSAFLNAIAQPLEIPFGLREFGRSLHDLATALAEFRDRPVHTDADHAVVARKKGRAVLIPVLRDRTDVGDAFGPGRPQRRARFFDLKSCRFDCGICGAAVTATATS